MAWQDRLSRRTASHFRRTDYRRPTRSIIVRRASGRLLEKSINAMTSPHGLTPHAQNVAQTFLVLAFAFLFAPKHEFQSRTRESLKMIRYFGASTPEMLREALLRFLGQAVSGPTDQTDILIFPQLSRPTPTFSQRGSHIRSVDKSLFRHWKPFIFTQKQIMQIKSDFFDHDKKRISYDC